MIPQQWTPPCNNQCTLKYSALMQIPWRVFCKKGCDTDGETWEECMGECEEICYKDPVLKDRQWSSYIDRSPGAAGYSELLQKKDSFSLAFHDIEEIQSLLSTLECFHACVSGCGYKFDIPTERVKEVHPSRPCKPPPAVKPSQPPVGPKPSADSSQAPIADIPCTSA